MVDPSLTQEVQITLIATGFGNSEQQAPGDARAAAAAPATPPMPEQQQPLAAPQPPVQQRPGGGASPIQARGGQCGPGLRDALRPSSEQ